MQKIPTLFKRDPDDMKHVLPEVTPGCEWVLAGEGRPTRKFDGTCVMMDEDGRWWARREVKPGKQPPASFQAISMDENTGKAVGWEPIEQSSFAKFHEEARSGLDTPALAPGTHELVGPKINGNPEGYEHHTLIRHDYAPTIDLDPQDLTYERLAGIMTEARGHFEGIVWHHPDGRMAKLKVRDFAHGSAEVA